MQTAVKMCVEWWELMKAACHMPDSQMEDTPLVLQLSNYEHACLITLLVGCLFHDSLEGGSNFFNSKYFLKMGIVLIC